MCAQFEIEKSMLVEKLKKLQIDMTEFNFKARILPHTPAPALIKHDNKIILTPMNFSLIPYWSKNKKPKFATHNARLETIKDKPTWKTLFGKKHCLVPMTSFIEPIYTGKLAGHMVKFRLNQCLFVPALFDSWEDKSTGVVVNSFAVLTSEPMPFVSKAGHDRSPIFINQDEIVQWTDIDGKNDDFFFALLNKKMSPDFSIEIDRKLKPGWETRIA